MSQLGLLQQRLEVLGALVKESFLLSPRAAEFLTGEGSSPLAQTGRKKTVHED